MEKGPPESDSQLAGDETTRLLKRWSNGDQSAFEKLKEHVHAELHRMAARYIRGERPGHIMQATQIVHDAYIQLFQLNKEADEREVIPWRNRSHFMGVAAEVMRHIIVDYARELRAKKRGGDFVREPLNPDDIGADPALDNVIAVHEVLDRLREVNPRGAAVVNLHFFNGFNFEETGEILGISKSTAQRHFEEAKKWLYRELKGRDDEAHGGQP